MELHDKNQSWTPPAGFVFSGLHAKGSFLIATYSQNIFRTGTTEIAGQNFVSVYLNDAGREVSRVLDRVDFARAEVPQATYRLTRTQRFKSGFFTARKGIGEMLKCRKN